MIKKKPFNWIDSQTLAKASVKVPDIEETLTYKRSTTSKSSLAKSSSTSSKFIQDDYLSDPVLYDNHIFLSDNSSDVYNGKLFDEEIGEEEEEEETVKKSKCYKIFQTVDSESVISEFEEERNKEDLQKMRMFYRRPIFLPKSKTLMKKYDRQISYFSERMAEDQYVLQELEDCMYAEKFGIYKDCKGLLKEKICHPENLECVTGLAFSMCGSLLAVGFGCGVFKILNLEKRRIYSPLPDARRSRILCVQCYPDPNEYLFVGTTRRGIILVCKYEEPIWTTWEYGQEVNNEINSFSFSAFGTTMVTGGKDATLRQYDFQTGQLVRQYMRYDMDCNRLIRLISDNQEDEQDGHYRRIYAIKFKEKDEHIFLSGGIDNTVKIWDTRTPKIPVQNIYGPHICGDALDVLETKVLTGQWMFNKTIELWDLRTSRRLHVMRPTNRGKLLCNEFPYCCKFLRHWDRVGMGDVVGDLIVVGGSGLEALEVQSVEYDTILHQYKESGQITTIAQYEDLIAYGATNSILGICMFYPSREGNEPELHNLFEFLRGVGEEIDLKTGDYSWKHTEKGLGKKQQVSTAAVVEPSVQEEEENTIRMEGSNFIEEEYYDGTDVAKDYIEAVENLDEEEKFILKDVILSKDEVDEPSMSRCGSSDSSVFGSYTESISSGSTIFNFPSETEFYINRK